MYGITPAHAPDCVGNYHHGMCDSWCYSHNQCEPGRPTDYMFCSECLHAFRSETELIRSHLLVMQKMSMDWPYEGTMDDYGRLPKVLTLRSDITATQIFTCPHCAHDL